MFHTVPTGGAPPAMTNIAIILWEIAIYIVDLLIEDGDFLSELWKFTMLFMGQSIISTGSLSIANCNKLQEGKCYTVTHPPVVNGGLVRRER